MQILIRDHVNQNEWNESLRKSEYGTVYQTTFYADYLKNVGKENPLFITGEENGKIVGQLLLSESSRLHNRLRDKPFGGFLCKLSRKLKPECHWYFGPVILPKEKEETYSQMLSAVHKMAKDKKMSISGATPHPLNDKVEHFHNIGFKSKEVATFTVDLRNDVEKLWLGLDKRSARKNVERAIERGVTIEIVEDKNGFNDYYNVLNETRIRDQVKPYRYMDVYRLWQILGQNDVMKCFISKKENRTLAGIMISTFNGYLNEWGAGQSTYAIENKLYANDLLKWHIIKWGHEQGYRYYDLTGVNPNPQTPKEQGIYRFKEKWGGNLVAYHEYYLKAH